MSNDLPMRERSIWLASSILLFLSWSSTMSIVEVHQQDGNGNNSTNACVLPQLRGWKHSNEYFVFDHLVSSHRTITTCHRSRRKWFSSSRIDACLTTKYTSKWIFRTTEFEQWQSNASTITTCKNIHPSFVRSIVSFSSSRRLVDPIMPGIIHDNATNIVFFSNKILVLVEQDSERWKTSSFANENFSLVAIFHFYVKRQRLH